MTLRKRNGLRTWIEIDWKAIRHNFGVFKKLIVPKTNQPRIGRVKLMAVVKSNAYGHGLVGFSREMEQLGADWLGVDSMVEALTLRKEGMKLPILVLGYTTPEFFTEAAAGDISLTVSTYETFEAIRQFCRGQTSTKAKPLKIHIKIDTGMHRQGFLFSEQKSLIAQITNHKTQVVIEGLYTHFANAKNPAFPQDTKAQIAEFEKWIVAFKKAGFKPIVHASATAGALLFPEAHYDMVRIGIGLYGLWPAREVREFLRDEITLHPVLEWKSIISEIKRLPKGSRIGYDLTETLGRDSVIGIIPIGYWHGYPRALSSIGRVIVKDRECKVLGRVSMDMLIVDMSNVKNPRVEDEAIIIGREQKLLASAEGIATLADGGSWYEVITSLNPLIKRIYL